MYPFAGERFGLMIVEASSGAELQEILGNLPLAGISTNEIHAISTVDAMLKTLETAEQRVAAMTPAGAR
jgi:hypothetical protein